MKIWIRVTWKAVEAAIAALKMLSVRQHIAARTDPEPEEMRKLADESDAHAEEFRKALHEKTQQHD